MSHFYAAIPTSARRTVATARGHTSTGISTYAASYAGRVAVYLRHCEETGEDTFEVFLEQHEGAGDRCAIASGLIGDAKSVRRCARFENPRIA